MSYYNYMMMFKDDEGSLLQDLAEDVESDIHFNRSETNISKLRSYFKQRVKEEYILEVIEKSLSMYEKKQFAIRY